MLSFTYFLTQNLERLKYKNIAVYRDVAPCSLVEVY